ncbi:MAG: sigma-E processing peptidase SpoIIGA [Oscillospiraceae bacterium]|nr:sigma-E processing peptidase SpoIIGA [Oscillospiraceae bacterium]
MTTIYLDTLFLTELAADFMLLLATDRFCAAAVSWKRLLAASVVGALYSVLYVLMGDILASVLMKIAFAVLMLLTAFGGRHDLLRCGAVFVVCSAAFAGIVLAVSVCCGGFGTKQMIFSFAAAYALLGGILRFSAPRGGTVKITLRHKGRSVSFIALRDTGSSLRDPISGAASIIAGEDTLLPLLDEKIRAALAESRGQAAEKRLEQLWDAGLGHGFKLLPYRALGVENGLLLAFRVDHAEVGGREIRGASAVLASQSIATGGNYSAIVSAEV